MKVDVLDKGYIELVDTLGDDLTPVNAARVSFGGRSDEFTNKDKRLSRFLIKHKHFSPFRHQHIMVIVKAPEFVLRQWYKHVVGIETTSSSVTKDHAWNEISGRYIPVQEYYHPNVWRKQSEDNKQASEGVLDDLQQKRMEDCYNVYMRQVEMTYDRMIEAGMAKLLAARVAWSTADNSLQIHGGNGFALEYPISRILCDSRILNIFEGAAEIQAQIIARRMLS